MAENRPEVSPIPQRSQPTADQDSTRGIGEAQNKYFKDQQQRTGRALASVFSKVRKKQKIAR